MKYQRILGTVSFVALSYLLCGFSGGFLGCFGASPTLLSVHVQDTQYRDGVLVSAKARPNQQVWGQWQFDNTTPQAAWRLLVLAHLRLQVPMAVMM
jgi:hypothetical protein